MKTYKRMLNSKATLSLTCVTLLFLTTGCKKDKTPSTPKTPTATISTITTGLPGIMGIETDSKGNIWVSEGGTDTANATGDTHNDNGKVVLVTPSGEKQDAIINLSSYANVHSTELQGTVHLLRDNNILYILSGDYLYKADISNYKMGDAPIDANTLTKEDIASVIGPIASPNNPENDSHPYDLVKGPDGDLYIVDAGANAIIHRRGENDYSVLAEFPSFSNPSFPGLGGPTVQRVPTSIQYDGSDFLVTTMTGFPFPADQAVIYKVSMAGVVSVYQNGFTMLVDQAAGKGTSHLVAQYASSFSPASGYTPNSGSLIWVDGSTKKVLKDGLNQPVSIKQVDDHTWYITLLGDSSIMKVTYE